MSALTTASSLWLVAAALVTIRATTASVYGSPILLSTTPRELEDGGLISMLSRRRLDRDDDDKYSSCNVIDEELLEELVGGEGEFLKTLTDSNTLVALEVLEFNVNNIGMERTGSLRVRTLDSRSRVIALSDVMAAFNDVSNLFPSFNLGLEGSAVQSFVRQYPNFQAIAVKGEVRRNGDDEEYRALVLGIPDRLRLLVYVDSEETDSVVETDFGDADGRWGRGRLERREKRKDRDDKQKNKFKTVKGDRREQSKKSNNAPNGSNNNNNFISINNSFNNNNNNDNNNNNNNNNNDNNNNNNDNNPNPNPNPNNNNDNNNNNNNDNNNNDNDKKKKKDDDSNDNDNPNGDRERTRRLQNKNNPQFEFDDDETLELSLDCENLDAACVSRIESEYEQGVRDIAAATMRRFVDLDQRVASLDRWKFQRVAVAGLRCFALYQNDLTARNVFDCIQKFLPSIKERFTLRYRPILNNHYEIQLQRLRSIDLLAGRKQVEAFYTCCPANRDDEDEEYVRRVLTAPTPLPPQSPAVPTAQEVFSIAEAPQEQRELQEDDSCLVDDFNDGKEGDLLDVSDNLYDSWVEAQGGRRRRLGGEPQGIRSRRLQLTFEGSTAPSDAFSIRDFDKRVQHSQQITHKNEGYALDVTQVAEVVIDLEAIVDNKGNLPKKVKKYIKKYEMDAAAVDATIPSTRGDIPFVGIIMTSDDTNKQLIWPVDFGLYATNVPEEELTRGRERHRRRTLRSMFGVGAADQQKADLAADQQRRLQDSTDTFAAAAANDVCNVSSNEVHAKCRDESLAAFNRETNVLVGEETAKLLELNKEETELYQALLQTHISAAFDCGAAEDGEIADLATESPDEYDEPTSFDPDATFDCVRFTRTSSVVGDYVTELSELQNRRRFVQERTKSSVAEVNLKWVARYKVCCLEDTLLGTNGSPGGDNDFLNGDPPDDSGLSDKQRAKLEKKKAKMERQLQQAIDSGKTKRAKKLRKKLDKVEKQLAGNR